MDINLEYFLGCFSFKKKLSITIIMRKFCNRRRLYHPMHYEQPNSIYKNLIHTPLVFNYVNFTNEASVIDDSFDIAVFVKRIRKNALYSERVVATHTPSFPVV